MAIMLMVFVGVFVICNIFTNVFWVLFYHGREATKSSIPYLWSISLLLETLNSSVNVIIYATFNQKFRKMFVKIFCSCCWKVSSPRNTMTAQDHIIKRYSNHLDGRTSTFYKSKPRSLLGARLGKF